MKQYRQKHPYQQQISERKISIYDSLEDDNHDLWIPTEKLEELLNDGLIGFSTSGLPLRTRSKVVKQEVCRILGYPIPKSFKKTQPRFFGQSFDTYIQKSNNLQIWNEDISDSRRYVIIKVSQNDIVEKVRVVTGKVLSDLDTTGTLTQKYQARLSLSDSTTELVSPVDTELILPLLQDDNAPTSFSSNPTQIPSTASLLSIS